MKFLKQTEPSPLQEVKNETIIQQERDKRDLGKRSPNREVVDQSIQQKEQESNCPKEGIPRRKSSIYGCKLSGPGSLSEHPWKSVMEDELIDVSRGAVIRLLRDAWEQQSKYEEGTTTYAWWDGYVRALEQIRDMHWE